MKHIFFYLLLLLTFQAQAQSIFDNTTSHIYTGGNLLNFGGQLEQGLNFEIGARKTFNRNPGSELDSSVGFHTGYFSYYNDGQRHRANTIGLSFGVSAEHLIEVVGVLDWFWQSHQFVPSVSMEAEFLQFGYLKVMGALQMGVLTKTNTSFFAPRIGIKYTISQ